MSRCRLHIAMITLALIASPALYGGSAAQAQSPPDVTVRDAAKGARWLKGRVVGFVKRQQTRFHQRALKRQADRQGRREFKQYIKGNAQVRKRYYKSQLDLRTCQAGIHKVMSAAVAVPALAHGAVTGDPRTLAMGAGMVALSVVDHVSQSRGNHRARVHALRFALRKGRSVPTALLAQYGPQMKAQTAADLRWAREDSKRARGKYSTAKAGNKQLQQRTRQATGLSKKVLAFRAGMAQRKVARAEARQALAKQQVDRLAQEASALKQALK